MVILEPKNRSGILLSVFSFETKCPSLPPCLPRAIIQMNCSKGCSCFASCFLKINKLGYFSSKGKFSPVQVKMCYVILCNGVSVMCFGGQIKTKHHQIPLLRTKISLEHQNKEIQLFFKGEVSQTSSKFTHCENLISERESKQ